jgi:hypothetical protein
VPPDDPSLEERIVLAENRVHFSETMLFPSGASFGAQNRVHFSETMR